MRTSLQEGGEKMFNFNLEKQSFEKLSSGPVKSPCAGSSTGCGTGENFDPGKSTQKHGQNQKLQSSGASCPS